MRDLTEIPRSSFHAWLTRTPSASDIADAASFEVIRYICARSPNSHGVLRDGALTVGTGCDLVVRFGVTPSEPCDTPGVG